MDDEIELVSDGDGLAVVGPTFAVKRFLESVGLLSASRELGLNRLGSAFRQGAEFTEAAAEAAALSGRWVKLTKESALAVKKYGLTATGTPGTDYAMVGAPGLINEWVKVDTRAGALLSNPAVLSGAAGIMSQMARQQEMNEITDMLATIDHKLDVVLRRQRDVILARLDGVIANVEEAKTIRNHLHGRVNGVAWSKVQADPGVIANVQRAVVLELEGLASDLESQTKIGELSKASDQTRKEAGVWLAALARCFELQNEIAVLELSRVMAESPEDLDGYRLGLRAAQSQRRKLILKTTSGLMSRMDKAATTAGSKALLHTPKVSRIARSINEIGKVIDTFHRPFGIDSHHEALKPKRWRETVREPSQWAAATQETGPKIAAAVLTIAGGLAITAVRARGDDNVDDKT